MNERRHVYRDIAQRHGTPTFLFDRQRLMQNAARLVTCWRDSFPDGHLYYSYKTNYLPEVCRCVHAAGLGADAVSGYELEHAARYAPGLPTVFNGPFKAREELVQALEMGATIHLDASEEIDLLCSLVPPDRRATVKLGLRVNPAAQLFDSADDSFVDAHLAAQRRSKFGCSIDDGAATALAQRAEQSGFSLRTVHCHLGSQITSAQRYLAALEPVLQFVAWLNGTGRRIVELNVGGGFGVAGLIRERRGWKSMRSARHGEPVPSESAQAFDMPLLCNTLRQALRRHGLEALAVSCEPGRYLVSDTFELLCRVGGVKRRGTGNWLILDGGLNLMPTASMGETRSCRFPTRADPTRVGVDGFLATVGGPLCYEGDVLMGETLVPHDIGAGDLVCIQDAGAYTVSRGTNFNRPRAPVVMHDDYTDSRLVWERETYDDIFRFSVDRSNAEPARALEAVV